MKDKTLSDQKPLETPSDEAGCSAPPCSALGDNRLWDHMAETHDLYLTVSEIEDIYGAAMPRYHAEYARLQNAISLLHEAGLLAQVVRHPEAMRQSWADGSEAMDCGEAGRMLNAAAEELEEKIAAFLEPNDKDMPRREPK